MFSGDRQEALRDFRQVSGFFDRKRGQAGALTVPGVD
jgi:hypothetical protein